ncbi:hypothetical protein [Gellertiella hungarica]|uniref:hypothetical protein n=1 Tax=Gellertiella hungarica TaxID=1572859 RepID=UPI0035EEFE5D
MRDDAKDLDLNYRLAKAEGGEDGTLSTSDAPYDEIALVRLEDRVDLMRPDIDAGGRREPHLLPKE